MDLKVLILANFLFLALCACAYAQPIEVEDNQLNTNKTNCFNKIPEDFLNGFLQALIEDNKEEDGKINADMLDVIVKVYGDQLPKGFISDEEIEITDENQKATNIPETSFPEYANPDKDKNNTKRVEYSKINFRQSDVIVPVSD